MEFAYFGLTMWLVSQLMQLGMQWRSQDFSKGGSQCVTPRVLRTSSCREYFDAKQISIVSFLTVVLGAKVLKILQIIAFFAT